MSHVAQGRTSNSTRYCIQHRGAGVDITEHPRTSQKIKGHHRRSKDTTADQRTPEDQRRQSISQMKATRLNTVALAGHCWAVVPSVHLALLWICSCTHPQQYTNKLIEQQTSIYVQVDLDVQHTLERCNVHMHTCRDNTQGALGSEHSVVKAVVVTKWDLVVIRVRVCVLQGGFSMPDTVLLTSFHCRSSTQSLASSSVEA